ncbi:MAG: hypothetical protein NXY57DRAFT_958781 [Lentinula lateritia]|nr:MAG: hypothetical protein NXY57DRAFT_958781 [Lentinula lateritia]
MQIWTFSTTKPLTNPAYSINSFSQYTALFVQVVLQLHWLLRTRPHRDVESAKQDAEAPLEPAAPTMEVYHFNQVWNLSNYLPYYLFNNACLCVWTISYPNHVSFAQLSLFAAIISQLRVILSMFGNANRRPTTTAPGMAILVSKTSLGMSVMLFWRTWSLVDNPAMSPTLEQQVHSGIVLVLLTTASGPDPTTGLTCIYVLLSLYFGDYQNHVWHSFFLVEIVILSVLLVVDSVVNRSVSNTDPQVIHNSQLLETNLQVPFRDTEERLTLFSLPEAANSSLDGIPLLPLHKEHITLDSEQGHFSSRSSISA